jgi:uncharacterized protein (TIGR00251 family)
MHGAAVKIRLTAPPVDGAANAALVRFLADRLALRPTAVSIVAGEKSRRKEVEIQGLDRATVLDRLGICVSDG